jgi:hypothetical protein
MPAISWRDKVQRNHDVRVGIDYRVDDRTTLGALAAGYDNRWSMTALNRLTIETNGTPISFIHSDNDEVNHWRHAMANENPAVYLNTSTDVASGQTTSEQMQSGKTTPLRITVAKADYTNSQGRWEVGAGVKGAFFQ